MLTASSFNLSGIFCKSEWKLSKDGWNIRSLKLNQCDWDLFLLLLLFLFLKLFLFLRLFLLLLLFLFLQFFLFSLFLWLFLFLWFLCSYGCFYSYDYFYFLIYPFFLIETNLPLIKYVSENIYITLYFYLGFPLVILFLKMSFKFGLGI